MTPEPTPTTPKQPSVIRKMVPIGRITADHAIQVRGRIESNKVKEYEAIIREQGFMDPCELYYEDPITPETQFIISDGFHRVEAYRAAGVEKIPCNLRVGNKTEAIKFALKKNGHHGAQLTNPEKRHAAEVAVTDPEIGNMTDKDIAAMIGCSTSLISEARRGITKQEATAKRKKKAEPAPAAEAPSAPSGKRESESPAPREVTVRERHEVGNRPTKARIIREITDYLATDTIDEPDLLKLMESKDAEYRFVKKAGEVTRLKIVGKSGRAQVEVDVVVKEVGYEGITLKFETGTLAVKE